MTLSNPLLKSLLFVLLLGVKILDADAAVPATSFELTPVDSALLSGRTIVIDPGHGGTALTDSYRVGPTGQREEWVNLRVSLMLRDLLAEAGANVLMTRTDDSFVELADRAQLAVDHRADLFISVHHNATADTAVNFPIIYYHGNASENRASVLLGRYLGREIRDALFTPDTHVSLVSDHTIFPTRGARVLLGSYGIPGVITEASFFSNRDEDIRLADSTYNRREAEALYRGIVHFFASMNPDRRIIRERYSTVRLEPLPVFQEAERMRAEALMWAAYVYEAAELLYAGCYGLLDTCDAYGNLISSDSGADAGRATSSADDVAGGRESLLVVGDVDGRATSSVAGDADGHEKSSVSGKQHDNIISEADLEQALELATRSVRYFPDSPLARQAHALRELALRGLRREADADKVRTRMTEFYVPVTCGRAGSAAQGQYSATASSAMASPADSVRVEAEAASAVVSTTSISITTATSDSAGVISEASSTADSAEAASADQIRILNEILAGTDITLSARIEHIDGTVLFDHESDKQVPSASVIKVQILAAMLLAHERGDFDMHALYRLQATDIVGGAGELQHSWQGTTLSYLDYARKMIRTSDNTATNVVIRAVGMEAVNALSTRHGGTRTRLARFMMDFDAIAQGRQNYTSAADMNRFFAAVLRGEVLSTSKAQLFFEILDDCDDQTIIAAGVPAHKTVANKSGALDYLRGDSGVVFGDQTYIVSVFAENFPDLATAELVLSNLVRRVIPNP